MNQLPTIITANSIELHYLFTDDTHTMDAVIQNKCEYDFLAIIKAVATTFEVEITIETEPLENGGLKRLFKVITKGENKNAAITTAAIVYLITNIFLAPIATSLTEVVKQSIAHFFEDKELKQLEKEKLKEEIKNIKEDTKIKTQKLNENTIVIKKRSDFYEAIEKYQKVEKIGVQIKYGDQNISDEKIVSRVQFKEYILATNKLEPIKIDNQEIEIISPVLKKGNYKWRGIYKGEPISFNMKSIEYKALVQTGKVEFKNGSSIKCLLELKRELDVEGREIVTDYNIILVNEYFVNDKPFETSEGKQHRQKQEADRSQLKMFGQD
ncbi:MAG TPA: hypothetical protein DCQ50_14120 [Chryseobacterium sp.]|nr:hypothetical protein [Chryseobacterium sp.]